MPFLRLIQRAHKLNNKSVQDKKPLDEVIAMDREARLYSRRRFIGDVAMAGAALAIPSFISSCATPKAASGQQYRIAIAGAGISGLHAAHLLKKAGYAATVYEASNRAGGRMFSGKNVVANNTVTELGGEFIDTSHKDILSLCKEFNLPLLDTYAPSEEGLVRDAFFFDGRFYSEEDVIRAFAPYSTRVQTDIDNLPDEISYLDTTASAIDNMSLAEYLQSLGMSGWLYSLLEMAYIGEYGLALEEQNALNFLWLFDPDTRKGFHVFGDSDERYKIIGGNDQLPAKMAESMSDQIRYDHKLTAIRQAGEGYSLHFADGSEAGADVLIMTLPFTVLRDIDIQVEMPVVKRKCIDELGYGMNSKLFLGFEERIWRQQGYQGFTFNDMTQCSWESSQLQNNNTGEASYTVYLGGEKGKNLAKSQGEEYLAHVNTMFAGAKSAHNGRVSLFNWPKNALVKGSYTCYRPGQLTTIGGAESEPVGNMYFAGEHCSVEFQGFMNGAAETGRMAAEAVLKRVKRKQLQGAN